MDLHLDRLRTGAIAGAAALAVGAAPLLTASPASATTVDVLLSPTANASANVNVGDTIVFRNSDGIVRAPVFTTSTGIACSGGLVIQPGSAQSCVVSLPGVFTYTDATRPGLTGGTITVNGGPSGAGSGTPVVIPSVTLNPVGPIVVDGGSTTLGGTVGSGAAGIPVDLLAREIGDSVFSRIASTLTTAGGAYRFSLVPTAGTEYRSSVQSGSTSVMSSPTTIKVRPRIKVTVSYVEHGRAYLTATVMSAMSYQGKRLQVQRHRKSGGWAAMRTVRMTARSWVKFSVAVPHGVSRIRVLMRQAQVDPGYTKAASNTVRVTRR